MRFVIMDIIDNSLMLENDYGQTTFGRIQDKPSSFKLSVFKSEDDALQALGTDPCIQRRIMPIGDVRRKHYKRYMVDRANPPITIKRAKCKTFCGVCCINITPNEPFISYSKIPICIHCMKAIIESTYVDDYAKIPKNLKREWSETRTANATTTQ